MEIEFDPHKEATNLKKHEISLKRAADLVVSDYELVVRKGEVRVQAIGVIDGEHFTTLRGTYEELAEGFRQLVDNYVATKYPSR